jgi:hypothetical protein
MSLYRGYFAPMGIDPLGLSLYIDNEGAKQPIAQDPGVAGGEPCRFGNGKRVGGEDIPGGSYAHGDEPYHREPFTSGPYNNKRYEYKYYRAARVYWEHVDTIPGQCGEAFSASWFISFGSKEAKSDATFGIRPSINIPIGFVGLEFYADFSWTPGIDGKKLEVAQIAKFDGQRHCTKFTSYLYVERALKIRLRRHDAPSPWRNDREYEFEGTDYPMIISLIGAVLGYKDEPVYTGRYRVYTCAEVCEPCSAGCPHHFGRHGTLEDPPGNPFVPFDPPSNETKGL